MSGLGFGEAECPKCNSQDIEHGDKDWDESGYVVPVKCLNCDFRYQINFWVKYDGLLDTNGEPLNLEDK